jgi:hypothetical protein
MAKKLTKTDTIEAAKSLVQGHPGIEALTVPEIGALDYSQRVEVARNFLRALLPMLSPSMEAARLNRMADFDGAFIDAAMKVWGNKVSELERRRRAFKKASSGITAEQAVAKIKALVESFRIRGSERSHAGYDGYTLEIERAWGVSGTLYIRLEREDGRTVNPDDDHQYAGSYRVATSMSWSSSTRTLAESVAVVKLYQELIEVAAEVEAVMARERVSWTWGVPEPAVEAPEAVDVVEA